MPTTEPTRAARTQLLEPEYLLALTLKNGVTGFFTGNIEPDGEGRIIPGIAVSIAAHEGAAAELLDAAWRGSVMAAYRLAAALRQHGLPGISVEVVEYHRAGGAT